LELRSFHMLTFCIFSSCYRSIHNKPVNKMWDWTAVDSVPVTAKAMLPSSSAITIQLGSGVRMITFVNTVPISENRCVNRWGLLLLCSCLRFESEAA
jgi:hypothetical protein